MLSRFYINGAMPVTLDDIKVLLSNAVKQMRDALRDAIPTAGTTSSSSLHGPTDPAADPRFQLWSWGGKMHMVPEGWRLPVVDVKARWHLWQYGHVEAKIMPLRKLRKADLQGAGQVALWSKTKGVMKAAADVMVEMKVVEAVSGLARLSAEESSAAFDTAIVQLMERVREGATRTRGRWMEMSIGTLYNSLGGVRAERKRKRDEQQQPAVGEAEEVADTNGSEAEYSGL